MVTFKKSMSFSLLATCAFLLMPFIDQTGSSGIKWMIWSLVVFATAAFIYGNEQSSQIQPTKINQLSTLMKVAGNHGEPVK